MVNALCHPVLLDPKNAMLKINELVKSPILDGFEKIPNLRRVPINRDNHQILGYNALALIQGLSGD